MIGSKMIKVLNFMNTNNMIKRIHIALEIRNMSIYYDIFCNWSVQFVMSASWN